MEAHWVSSAVNSLRLTEDQIVEVPVIKAQTIVESIKEIFLSDYLSLNWWENLLCQDWSKEVEDAWRYLPSICPEGKLWFVPLQAHSTTHYKTLLYESSPSVVSEVLGECPAFEYALVGKKMDWLLIENHHGYLIIRGKEATKNAVSIFGH